MSVSLRRKPHLNEIFGAFSGIGHAAMGVPLDHPLALRERLSSDLRYDLRQGILDPRHERIVSQKDYQDQAAAKALAFLKKSLPLLNEHKTTKLMNAHMQETGGTLEDVILHINSLLEREAKGEKREVLKCSLAGDLTPKFTAAYIPTGAKFKEPDYEPDMNDFLAEDSPKPERQTRKSKSEVEIVPSVMPAIDSVEEESDGGSIQIPSFLPRREPAMHA